ncbi:metallophosphoesterase [Methylobacterium sp. C25]|uniref:metallophosphoesterase family protein n=1 Tax=Methylobacterium sp. C25 TaxID=2721622 RepID=UPI001F16CAE9|nr:metallophosphoesterase family protein [Methylobacterium sp. C25]MCE4224046.1 metallophosphoesterase [Methylobacterium sp. C25]
MAVFFTADTHFGHEGILAPRMARPRPFAGIEAHDEAIVARWNDVVRPEDEVWHLGDFAFSCSFEHASATFARLNGTKHLVVGNHEKLGRRLPWASQHEGIHQIAVDGHRLVLCHYAMRAWPGIWRGALHLYGHTHGSLSGTRRSCDVGVDVWDYRPVTLPEILDAMALSDTWPEELQGSEQATG